MPMDASPLTVVIRKGLLDVITSTLESTLDLSKTSKDKGEVIGESIITLIHAAVTLASLSEIPKDKVHGLVDREWAIVGTAIQG